jgi:hypothetical protein
LVSSLTIGLISAGCIFGGAFLGFLLQGLLPEHHLRDASKDTVKVAAGTIATMSALVLGLLVGSAKSSFDATNTAIIQNGAKVILLDRALAAYGPETKDVREQLRRAVAAGIEMFWPEEKKAGSGLAGFERANAMEMVQAKLRELTPATGAARAVPRGASLLAYDAAPKLRPVRASQSNRDHRVANQCVVCLGRDFYHSGDEPPAQRHDQSFQRADAQGPGTSGAIKKGTARFRSRRRLPGRLLGY